MRMSKLIRERREAILEDFEEFARTHTVPGAHMDVETLRDHAAAILEAFAKDLDRPQNDEEQRRKSRGDAIPREGAPSAAEKHGADRAGSGFTLPEMFAEYRALRASVIRHWSAARTDPHESDIDDLIRFNESIDEAIGDSIVRYARSVANYRDMFLAVLGHDLRTPVNAVMAASNFLIENSGLPERDDRLARSIRRSAGHMNHLIGDMLDYTASQLGRGMPVNRTSTDLGEIAREAVDEVVMIHPDRDVRLETSGRLDGEWDERRVRQALSNLIENAVQHAPDSPVTVRAHAGEGEPDVIASVHNLGPGIPADERSGIFEPFRRGAGAETGTRQQGMNLGLGLYIAREIVIAHGGRIEVESSPVAGTTFSLRLPRSVREELAVDGAQVQR